MVEYIQPEVRLNVTALIRLPLIFTDICTIVERCLSDFQISPQVKTKPERIQIIFTCTRAEITACAVSVGDTDFSVTFLGPVVS